jgi:hypothetical protein
MHILQSYTRGWMTTKTWKIEPISQFLSFEQSVSQVVHYTGRDVEFGGLDRCR